MDEDYDVVVLGTGLKECILSGLMSIEGKKVLHMDKNDYYGGKSTSITPLKQLFSYFNVAGDIERFGVGKEWNVDLIPKFLMSNGNLVALLIHTGVLRYLEFKQIEGSYVYQNGGIHKVPCDEAEALSSNLMSLFEKRRFRKLLVWVMNVKPEVPSTWNDVYHFEIGEDTQIFIGHAICLYPDDSYKEKVPAAEVIQRMQLIVYCRAPISFVFIDYFLSVHHNPLTKYFPLCSTQVVRAICLLNHPIPNVQSAASCQIIIPQNASERHHDIYISCVSHSHMVCPENFFVALVATTVETDKPHDELKPGLDLLGPIEQVFYSIEDLYEPVDDGRSSKLFISSSYDASTHFESTCEDVLNLYERITGQPFDFSKKPP
ncbi:unnamed protein product [Echinostoma caproni]|uniref:Rab GDP dissociation inhibitor n=1 Tax=Echinostoma caproni TaxID=27848 RepID=A0A183B027_9TREM|nr:unnamed protein product [Echinostoma caproni]